MDNQHRLILHCDLNNFYASVETLLNPKLKGCYVAVCGSVDERHGIVLAKNTLAKQKGVKTGDVIWEARQKCPDLVVVPPHYEQYVNYSVMVKDIYLRYTNQVESFGMDECWLDMGNANQKDMRSVADSIRNDVRQETGLTISVGASFNKIYAKLGSDLKKPDATTVIDYSNYKSIVYPLAVDELLMIGKRTAAQLRRLGICTIGDLADADCNLLTENFGINGLKIKRYADGSDNSPVAINGMEGTVKSVGHGTTPSKDISTLTMAKQTIFSLAELVATRMRRYKLKGGKVHVDIRYNTLEHKSHQGKLPYLTYNASTIANTAYELLKQVWNPSKHAPLRTLTISVAELHDEGNIEEQMSLFVNDEPKKEAIERAVDKIRSKYGYSSVKRALLLENAILVDKYCDEDDLLPFRRSMR